MTSKLQKMLEVGVPSITQGLNNEVFARNIDMGESPQLINVEIGDGVAGTRPGRNKSWGDTYAHRMWDEIEVAWDDIPGTETWGRSTYTVIGGSWNANSVAWNDHTTETWSTLNYLSGRPVIHMAGFMTTDAQEHIYAITDRRAWDYAGVGWMVMPDQWGDFNGDCDAGTIVSSTSYPTSDGNIFIFSLGWDDVPRAIGKFGDLSRTRPLLGHLGAPFNTWKTQCMSQLAEHVIMFGLEESGIYIPFRVRWSSIGDVYAWDSGVGSAGFVDLVGTHGDIRGPDWIVWAERIGNAIAIYKEWSIILMQYIGGSSIFSFQTVVPNEGCVSSRCVVPVPTAQGPAHIVLGRAFPYIFNGTAQVFDIGTKRIAKDLYQGATLNTWAKSYGYYVPQKKKVRFHVPFDDRGHPNRVFEYNIDEDSWSYHECDDVVLSAWPRSERGNAERPGQTYTWLLTGDSDSYIQSQDGISEGYGSDRKAHYDTRVDTKRFVLQDGHKYVARKQRVMRLGYEVRGSGTLSVYVRYDGGAWTLLGTNTLSISYSDYYQYPNNSCQDVQFSFRTTGPDSFFLKWVQIGFHPRSGR